MSEYIVDGAEPNNTVLKSITKNGYEHEKWLPVRERIVRCRDCKHCTQRDAIFPPIVCERWGYYNFKTEPDRFCAWGERRTEQNGLKRSSDAE